MNENDADKLDAYLGDGTYDKWNVLDDDARRQIAKAKRLDKALRHYKSGLIVLSPYGTDLVEKIRSDFLVGFELMLKRGDFPYPKQFEELFEIYPIAIDLAEMRMEEAESLNFAWMISGFAGMRPFLLSRAVARLRNDLRELLILLHEAEADEIDANLKAGLGFAITTVTLIAPGLGLLASISLSGAEYLLAETVPAKVSKATKAGFEVIEHVDKAEGRIGHFAKGGAKVLTVTGFYFDAEEILHASKNVKKIKELLDRAHREYRDLQSKLSSAVKAYKLLEQRRATHVAAVRSRIVNRQRDLDALLQRYSYSRFKPVAWNIMTHMSEIE